MEQSILTSAKKVIGLTENDTSYDADLVTHINSIFMVLNQLGIGPDEGFLIEDSTTTWDTFIGTDKALYAVKTYMHLRLRNIFDPPQTSFAIQSMKEQIQEFEVRLSIHREGKEWVPAS